MSDTLYKVYIHIVFSTLGARDLIPEQNLSNLHRYIYGIFVNERCHDIFIGGISNHVHILTSLPKDKTIPQIVKTTKTATNLLLTEQYKVSNFAWQKGYAVFSVRPTELAKVKNYIKNQKQHHKQTSFAKEMEKIQLLCSMMD